MFNIQTSIKLFLIVSILSVISFGDFTVRDNAHFYKKLTVDNTPDSAITHVIGIDTTKDGLLRSSKISGLAVDSSRASGEADHADSSDTSTYSRDSDKLDGAHLSDITDLIAFALDSSKSTAYSEIHFHDDTTAVVIPTGASYTKLNIFDKKSVELSHFGDTANDQIICGRSGMNFIDARIPFYMTSIPSGQIDLRPVIFVNGDELDNTHGDHGVSVTNRKGTLLAGSIARLVEGDTITVRVRQSGGSDATIYCTYGHLVVFGISNADSVVLADSAGLAGFADSSDVSGIADVALSLLIPTDTTFLTFADSTDSILKTTQIIYDKNTGSVTFPRHIYSPDDGQLFDISKKGTDQSLWLSLGGFPSADSSAFIGLRGMNNSTRPGSMTLAAGYTGFIWMQSLSGIVMAPHNYNLDTSLVFQRKEDVVIGDQVWEISTTAAAMDYRGDGNAKIQMHGDTISLESENIGSYVQLKLDSLENSGSAYNCFLTYDTTTGIVKRRNLDSIAIDVVSDSARVSDYTWRGYLNSMQSSLDTILGTKSDGTFYGITPANLRTTMGAASVAQVSDTLNARINGTTNRLAMFTAANKVGNAPATVSGNNITFNGDITAGTTSKSSGTVISALSGDNYTAGFRTYGNSQGSGRFFAGQSVTHGGGFIYQGDVTPALVAGSRQDYLTFYFTRDGADTAVFDFSPTPFTSIGFYRSIDMMDSDIVNVGNINADTGTFNALVLPGGNVQTQLNTKLNNSNFDDSVNNYLPAYSAYEGFVFVDESAASNRLNSDNQLSHESSQLRIWNLQTLIRATLPQRTSFTYIPYYGYSTAYVAGRRYNSYCISHLDSTTAKTAWSSDQDTVIIQASKGHVIIGDTAKTVPSDLIVTGNIIDSGKVTSDSVHAKVGTFDTVVTTKAIETETVFATGNITGQTFNGNSAELTGDAFLYGNLTSDTAKVNVLKVTGDTSYLAPCSIYVGATYKQSANAKFLIRNKMCSIMFTSNFGSSISSTNTDTVFIKSNGNIPAAYDSTTRFIFSSVRHYEKYVNAICIARNGKLVLLNPDVGVSSYNDPYFRYYFQVVFSSVTFPLP